VGDAVCHRAHHEPLDESSAASAHHQEVGILVAANVSERGRRLPYLLGRFPIDSVEIGVEENRRSPTSLPVAGPPSR